MNFKDLKLKSKLLLGFTVIVIILLTTGIRAYFTLENLSQKENEMIIMCFSASDKF